MKYHHLFLVGVVLLCSLACKKDQSVIQEEKEIRAKQEKDPLELLSDSMSYILDGTQLIMRRSDGKSSSIMNDIVNAKLDSIVKNQEYKSGDKDSVMFGRGFEFRDNNEHGIEIMFIKKYNQKQDQQKTNESSFFIPSNKLDLFSIGERKFALDFKRNNSQDGILLELKGAQYGFQTNGYSSLAYHKLLSKELQSQSKFEIIKLQKLKSGKYIVEARFNASVYWGDGTNIKKIENGYLRLKINPEVLYL